MRYLLLLVFSITFSLNAQQLAFPSALGAGAYATGGRGGKICVVNTLTWDTAVTYDAATDSYSGGFYNMFYELDIPSRIIVFSVSGTIVVPTNTVLNFRSKTNKGNITVAGQTANIVFETSDWRIIDVENLVWRYCSFYNDQTNDPGADVLSIQSEPEIASGVPYTHNTENIVIDHCSFYYGGDECLSISGRFETVSTNGIGAGNPVTKVTVQNSIFAASSKGNIVGSYIGDIENTVARCAYIENAYRYPNLVGYGSNSYNDAINNYAEEFSARLIRTTGSGNFNVVNNYYKPNPVSVNYGRQRVQYQSTAPPQIWSSGNIIETAFDTPQSPDFDQWLTFAGSDIGEDLPMPNDAKAPSQFALRGQTFDIWDANVVLDSINDNIGQIKRLDASGNVITDVYALDSFYIDLMVNPTVDVANNTRYPTNRYPTPNIVAAPLDTDKDGMPDAYEDAQGYDKNDYLDGRIVQASGYTAVEEYLNLVDTVSESSPPDTVDLVSVTMSQATATLNAGQTINLTVTFNPSNATDKTGTWSSSNEAVATVNQSGLVSYVSNGTATITFTANDTANGTLTATCNITAEESQGGGSGNQNQNKNSVKKSLLIIGN